VKLAPLTHFRTATAGFSAATGANYVDFLNLMLIFIKNLTLIFLILSLFFSLNCTVDFI
jgi:hypothetical protein